MTIRVVAIKFHIEITTVVNTLLKCKVASILSPYVQVRKSKLEKRKKHVEADQKRQVGDVAPNELVRLTL